MNPYNQRKEPTFGEPSVVEPNAINESEVEVNKTVENKTSENAVEKKAEHLGDVRSDKPKIALSLHTKNAPNYTFTPVMKRPAGNAQILSTLEEKAEQTMSNEKAPLNEPTPPTTQGKSNGGFTFAPIAEDKPAVEPVSPTLAPKEPIPSVTATNSVERVIPASTAKVTKATVEKVPSKYRRLMIVLLLLILVGLAIFLLKPKTPESVETLQEQGSSLLIEFRPVDEEEAKRAESQEKALQEAQQKSETEQQASQLSNVNEQTNKQETAVQANSQQQVVGDNTTTQPVVTEQPTAVVAKPAEYKPATVVVKKPETSGSVIYQPETVNKAVKTVSSVSKEAQPKSVQAKPTVHSQPKENVVKPVTVVKQVVVKQPATASAPAPIVKAVPVQVATTASAVVASKTLTVPKGVSLMQVFRDHNLNISDVNAMSKVNGVVSHLKVGEKVTVRLDKNNRVAEMSIGSGGKFIRQANGSYIYQ